MNLRKNLDTTFWTSGSLAAWMIRFRNGVKSAFLGAGSGVQFFSSFISLIAFFKPPFCTIPDESSVGLTTNICFCFWHVVHSRGPCLKMSCSSRWFFSHSIPYSLYSFSLVFLSLRASEKSCKRPSAFIRLNKAATRSSPSSNPFLYSSSSHCSNSRLMVNTSSLFYLNDSTIAMERQERKDGVDGAHNYTYTCVCVVLLKFAITKNTQSAALCVGAFTYFFSPSGHDRKKGMTVAETNRRGRGGGLFSSQKKGKWLYRDEI